MNTKEPSVITSELPQATSHLTFEADKYLEHVEEFEMSEAQKVEFLRALWDIMSTFVRLGFGVESVLPALFKEASTIPPNGLEETIPTHEFNVAAEDKTNGQEE